MDETVTISLDDETRWILGRPCFAVIGIVKVLRQNGHDIARKAEDEQAAAIFWMLQMYVKHGEDWRDKASKWLSEQLQPPAPSGAEQGQEG